MSKSERKKLKKQKRKFRAINRSWAPEDRPDDLQTMEDFEDFTYGEAMIMKDNMEKEKKRRDLGEDVCQQDSKPKKIKHKAATDNGTSKLHEARYHRMPICHPKEYYHKMPKKREEIIRSFPMDHYGVQGQVPAAVIGKLHNRTALQSFDGFVKTSFKPGKTGKYADKQQLEEGLLNYGTMMQAIWPYDYSLFPVWRVLCEEKWGEKATADEKKRSDLVIEFVNGILADNSAKAVNGQYPCVFDQVNYCTGTIFT
jgi:hypothetical protein